MSWKQHPLLRPYRVPRYASAWRQLHFPPSDGLNLHIGCGQRHLAGFVNIDINHSPATDWAVAPGSRLPCPDASVRRIETYHVIEHIPYPVVRPLLQDWFRVLRPRGELVIECPDFEADVRGYLAGNKELLYSIFGRHRFPGDDHHWGYTVASLREMLMAIGFSEVRAAEPQDYHKEHEPCLRVEATK